MDIERIKEQLDLNNGTFPAAAVRAAVDQREAITPELLAALQAAADDPEGMMVKSDLMLYIFAMYLLAQFREKAAYPLLVKFFSIPGEICLDLTGDVVTEDLGRILASVCHNELEPIKRMIEDPAVNEYVRSACLRTLVILVLQGKVPREQIVNYFHSLFNNRLERKPDFIWSALVVACRDLYPEELIDDIERAYDDGLVDYFYIRMDRVRMALAEGEEKVLQRSRQFRADLIDDTVAEMASWACFQDKTDTPTNEYLQTATPSTVKKKKIGRNDPCPCGSGKKYKKCCLQ
ncbi:MAG: DUF1186 domain-containing protein [Chromatiaceae bacterium]